MLKVSGNFAGSLTYQSTWDAKNNIPFLQSSVGTKGFYYVVSVAGNTNLNGITNWNVGDWAVFDGNVWEKVDNNNAVTSVNGQTGAVVLNAANVGATPNTTFVIAGTGLNGGGQLVGNVTLNNTGVLAFNTRTGNVTLTSTDVTTALGYTPGTGNGTVTAVTATAPISSSGGTTPNISISQANATVSGYLSSTDWNTFNNKQPSGTYVTSVTATSPISSSGGTTPNLSISLANATTSGYLSSTDWNTFNSKGTGNVSTVNTGTGLTGGPITTSGTISLANTTVTTGNYGSASSVGTFTVNQQGQLTAAANATIAIGVSQVSGAVPNTVNVIAGTGLSGGGALTGNVTLNVVPNTTNQNVTVQNNGVLVGSQPIINFAPSSNTVITTANDTAGTRSNVTIDLANTTVTPGTYGNASTVSQVVIDAKGRVTSASNVAIAISNSAISGLGTMSVQNANNVAITGGSISVPNVFEGYTTTTAANATTVLTSTSNHWQKVSANGTNTQTFQLPDATTLSNGASFIFDNDAGGNVTINDSTSALVDTIIPGAIDLIFLESNSTAAGSWGKYSYLPAYVNWGTSTADFGNVAVSNVVITSGQLNVTTTNMTATTAANATFATASLPLVPAGYINFDLNGTVVKIPYYAV